MSNNYPEDLRYTEQHEWVRVEGKSAFVGITDFAQHELGDIVYVELPSVNQNIEVSEKICTVESVKTVSDVYSPVSGKIITINADLEDNPDIINEDPYGDGWMVEIEISNTEEIQGLMTAAEYKNFVEEAAS
ncbi:MAG: glycine cleavage system protein GcvH [Candidatus Wallbacteria bacterium]